jgi:polyhydroxybutyrate depolymerase
VTARSTKSRIGCKQVATPGTTTQTLAVDGIERQYVLSVPESYDPAERAPLLLNFHGLGSNKEHQALYTRMNQRAGAAGYVVVTPDGTGGALKHWSFPPMPRASADVDFVTQILRATSRGLCIDAERVYATGISNGAMFSTFLACALPGRLAAIAPVAGVNGPARCSRGAPPTPLVAFHGTADPIVPYAGGRYFAGANQNDAFDPTAGGRRAGVLRARPVEETVARWAAFDGCGARPSTKRVAVDVELVSYTNCTAHGAVELYRVVGGGHTWPGAVAVNPERLGWTTSAIDATGLMLEFFAAHPRRP